MTEEMRDDDRQRAEKARFPGAVWTTFHRDAADRHADARGERQYRGTCYISEDHDHNDDNANNDNNANTTTKHTTTSHTTTKTITVTPTATPSTATHSMNLHQTEPTERLAMMIDSMGLMKL
jgi:hypothetical protein